MPEWALVIVLILSVPIEVGVWLIVRARVAATGSFKPLTIRAGR